jgi:uncharacterized membrane protein YfcA
MPELDATFVWAVLIVLVAAATSGLAGFGFSIISVSPLLALYDPATVIAINKILTLGTTWIVLVGAWHAISWRHLRRLVPLALVGLFVGVAVLKTVNPQAIKLAVGITVVLFAVLLLSGRIRPLPEAGWMAPVAGFVSGVSSTSTAMSGPPLVLFFTVIELPMAAFRATSVMYFVCLDLVGFPTLVASGVITRADLILATLLAPVALLGRWIGAWLVPYVTPLTFRRVVLVLLLATGGIGIANALSTM